MAVIFLVQPPTCMTTPLCRVLMFRVADVFSQDMCMYFALKDPCAVNLLIVHVMSLRVLSCLWVC